MTGCTFRENGLGELIVRLANTDDLDSILKLYADTINNVNNKHYSQEQIEVWISGNSDRELWKRKILEQKFFVAEIENRLIGFGSVTNDGYVDFIFVHKDFQRQGIASSIYDVIEIVAKENNLTKLYADVSIAARPFFKSKGFTVTKFLNIKSGGVEFEDCEMTKNLN